MALGWIDLHLPAFAPSATMDVSNNRDHVFFRDGFNFRLGKRRKVCRLDSPHVLSSLRMMRLQVSHQVLDRAALARAVADQHDLVGWHKILRDLLIEGSFFWYMLPAIMRFLAMDEMVVEMERVIWANRNLIFRAAAIDILVNVGRMVIDHDDDATRLGSATWVALRASFFQKLAQTRNLLNPEFMVVRFLEEGSLRSNDEGEFVAPMRFRDAEMLNQFNRLAPAQIARQLAVQKTLMQQIEIVTTMFTHLIRIAFLTRIVCSSLLIRLRHAVPEGLFVASPLRSRSQILANP
jgi:hypothetical protein